MKRASGASMSAAEFAKMMKPCDHPLLGYIQHMKMMEHASKTYDQLKCDKCNRYHIWRKKEKCIKKI
jgi:hypothetical protein